MISAAKWLFLACLAIAPSFSYGADTAALAKRLHNAADASSLDDPALKPWHLKLAVQLYDAKGKPSEQGTIEEWWTPDAYKRVYATLSYTATELYSNKTVYRTKGQPPVPYLLDAALRFVVHPVIASETIDRSDLTMQVQSFGKSKLDCVIVFKPGKYASPVQAGRAPTSCFDPGGDELRASWQDPEISVLNSTGLFQARRVGVDTSISAYGVKSLSQHVETLDSKVFDGSIFTPSSDLDKKLDDPVWVSTGLMESSLISKVAAIYPDEAKFKHVSGTVMLITTIGTDGHVLSTDTVGSPDPSLAKSATAAVKQWVYAPHLVDGAAVKVRTPIRVWFNFGVGGVSRI